VRCVPPTLVQPTVQAMIEGSSRLVPVFAVDGGGGTIRVRGCLTNGLVALTMLVKVVSPPAVNARVGGDGWPEVAPPDANSSEDGEALVGVEPGVYVGGYGASSW